MGGSGTRHGSSTGAGGGGDGRFRLRPLRRDGGQTFSGVLAIGVGDRPGFDAVEIDA